MVRTNRKEGSYATRRDSSLVGTGGAGRCPCDCDRDVMLDREVLIAIVISVVLRRLRSAMVPARGIIPHGVWDTKRTIVKYERLRNTHAQDSEGTRKHV